MTSHQNDAGAHAPSRSLQPFSSPFSRRDAIRFGALASGAALIPRGISASTSNRGAGATRYQDGEVQSGVELSIPLDPFGQPLTLDPHRATDWGPNWVMLPYVWSGLLAFDENGDVVSDLAEEVVPGDDAATWTATLREELTFASGTNITAQHFVDSWKRALDPTNVAPMATFMEPVLGFDEYIGGTSTDIGFEATDDRTIEIRLKEPVANFPAYLATFVWAVVDLEAVVASVVDFPLNDAGAGQWRFTEFVDNDHIAMEPNTGYWDEASPSVTKIVWPFMDSVAAATDGVEQYKNDEIASLDVPLSLLATVEDDPDLAGDLITIEPQGSTMAIGLDFNQPPFNDVRIRQAIAASIDTATWANEIWQGSFVPAAAFTPPSTTAIAGYEPPAIIAFDADRAKQLVEEAGFQTGDAQAEITYYQPATDPAEDQERHAALLQMIADNCGIAIAHDTGKTVDQIVSLQGDLGGRQFDIVWWWPTSNTPSLLARVGQSTSPFMSGWFNWSPDIESEGDLDPGTDSSEFDRLTTEAGQELDETARNERYAQAETLMLDNAVYIPLGHWVQRFVQKPWLQGTRQGPWTGRIPVRIDKGVVVVGGPNATAESE